MVFFNSLFILFFIGGYLLYSGLMAAIGAAVDEEVDSQQFPSSINYSYGFCYNDGGKDN